MKFKIKVNENIYLFKPKNLRKKRNFIEADKKTSGGVKDVYALFCVTFGNVIFLSSFSLSNSWIYKTNLDVKLTYVAKVKAHEVSCGILLDLQQPKPISRLYPAGLYINIQKRIIVKSKIYVGWNFWRTLSDILRPCLS